MILHIAGRSLSHTAWNTLGNYADQTLTLIANAIKPSMKDLTPANSSLLSAVNLEASATPSDGEKITGWCVYRVGLQGQQAAYNGDATDSINTSLKMSTAL